MRKLTTGKLRTRMAQNPECYADLSGSMRINGVATPRLHAIIDKLEAVIADYPDRSTPFMHGDFCFSNILYNSRNNRISLIDPRGYIDVGVYETGGDLRYDIAKLAHSIVGNYDRIVAAQFTYARCGDQIAFAVSGSEAPWRDKATSWSFAGVALDRPDVTAAMITLFLSMIPLHSDKPDRQAAFHANALLLYNRFFGEQA